MNTTDNLLPYHWHNAELSTENGCWLRGMRLII